MAEAHRDANEVEHVSPAALLNGGSITRPDGDGRAEIITGAGGGRHVRVLDGKATTGAGPGGGAHVKVFDKLALAKEESFLLSNSLSKYGVAVG